MCMRAHVYVDVCRGLLKVFATCIAKIGADTDNTRADTDCTLPDTYNTYVDIRYKNCYLNQY